MGRTPTTMVRVTETQKEVLDETQELIKDMDGGSPSKGDVIKRTCEAFQEAQGVEA